MLAQALLPAPARRTLVHDERTIRRAESAYPGTGPLGAVALCAVDNGGEKRRDRDPEDRENPDGMLMEMVLRTR
jgi:hypothetical protein